MLQNETAMKLPYGLVNLDQEYNVLLCNTTLIYYCRVTFSYIYNPGIPV